MVNSRSSPCAQIVNGFRADQRSSTFGVQPAPTGQTTVQTVGRKAAHRLGGVSGPSGAAGPLTSTISSRPENCALKAQLCILAPCETNHAIWQILCKHPRFRWLSRASGNGPKRKTKSPTKHPKATTFAPHLMHRTCPCRHTALNYAQTKTMSVWVARML